MSAAVRSLPGRILLRDICKTGGKAPRDFQLFGEYLIAVHQGSDCLSVLRLGTAAARLQDTGIRIPAICPTCICAA